MNGAVERFDERARRAAGAHGRTVIHPGELLRHPVYTRIVHWTSAAFFVAALLTGFAVYTPWMYRWLAPLFGGGPMTRLLHPWFGLAFCIAFTFQILNWLTEMAWNADDRRWMGRIREYVSNADKTE